MNNFGLTTFSSKGKLTQVEYALKAVSNGDTALGIKAKNGVVIAVEKKLASPLIDEESFSKIQLVSGHIGVVYAGLGPDFRVLVKNGRKEAMKYKAIYEDPITVYGICKRLAQTMQDSTQRGGVRPYGVSLLLAGYDEEGPQLYQIDPSGLYIGWKAAALGKNQSSAKNFLEKRYSEDLELEDAIHIAILTLKEGYEVAITEKNIEIGVIGMDGIFKILTQQEIKDYLRETD